MLIGKVSTGRGFDKTCTFPWGRNLHSRAVSVVYGRSQEHFEENLRRAGAGLSHRTLIELNKIQKTVDFIVK